MNFKRLLSTTVLTISLLATGCGPKETVNPIPAEHEDGHYTITVNNKEYIESPWMVGGAARSLDLSIAKDGTAKAVVEEMIAGNLTFTIERPALASNNGITFTATGVGQTTVAITYGETVKHVKLDIVSEIPAPAVITGKTINQILDDVETTGDTRIYEVRGKLKGFHSKTEWNQYGECDITDETAGDNVIYLYGSYVNTEAEPASFPWDGEKFSYKYTARNVLTADMTKDLKKGDEVVINVLYAPSYKNFYGIWQSVTAGPEVAATSVKLDKTVLSLEEGDTAKLTATIEPDDCNQKAIWTTSDAAIAKVNGGTVTAVAEGNATITCTVGEKSATCSVKVEKAVPGVVKLTPESLLGYAGTNIAYTTEEADHTYKSVTYGVTNIGAFGNGLQFKKNLGIVRNKTAFAKDITKIEFTIQAGKGGYSNEGVAQIKFAATLEGLATATPVSVSTVKDQYEGYSFTAPAGMKFFSFDNIVGADKSQTLYLANIKVTVAQ